MATALEIARKFAEYGDAEKARRAYSLFLGQKEEKDPKDELEAASYIFFSKVNRLLMTSLMIVRQLMLVA